VRGYDRAEVDRLLADIADSFEAVWHERTRLYQDVLRLQEQLKREQAAITTVRSEVERARADRSALLAELEQAQADVRQLRAAMEQLEPGDLEAERRLAAERAQLREATDELRKERDRLLDEVRRMDAATAEERNMRERLVDFLLDGLKRVERVPLNGSEATVERGELPFQDGAGPRSPSDSAPEDESTGLPR
jgi:chromosome segregation ATPase